MRWLTGTMVVVEVALTLVLLVGAGLMIRSFLNLYRIDIGMRIERLMAMQPAARRRQVPEAGGAAGLLRAAAAAAGGHPRRRARGAHDQRSAISASAAARRIRRPAVPKIDDAPTVAVTISPAFFDVVGLR